jgi:hypothetical protein
MLEIPERIGEVEGDQQPQQASENRVIIQTISHNERTGAYA